MSRNDKLRKVVRKIKRMVTLSQSARNALITAACANQEKAK